MTAVREGHTTACRGCLWPGKSNRETKESRIQWEQLMLLKILVSAQKDLIQKLQSNTQSSPVLLSIFLFRKVVHESAGGVHQVI